MGSTNSVKVTVYRGRFGNCLASVDVDIPFDGITGRSIVSIKELTVNLWKGKLEARLLSRSYENLDAKKDRIPKLDKNGVQAVNKKGQPMWKKTYIDLVVGTEMKNLIMWATAKEIAIRKGVLKEDMTKAQELAFLGKMRFSIEDRELLPERPFGEREEGLLSFGVSEIDVEPAEVAGVVDGEDGDLPA